MNPFIGQIVLFGGNFAPRAWAFCDGALLAISSNTALFSILGTTYGGDGRTTFALPDLRGRVTVGPRRGPGLSNYDLGERGGVQSVVLNSTQLPSHTHFATNNSATDQHILLSSAAGVRSTPIAGDVPSGASFGPGISATAVNAYGPGSTANVLGQQLSGSAGLTLQNTGNGQSHENRQPFLAVNYIIAMFGTYPSRS